MGTRIADVAAMRSLLVMVLASVGSSVSALSCAHEMQVTSDPAGAAIFVDGKPAGATPATLAIPLRETPLHVRVTGATGSAELTVQRNDVDEAIAASGALAVTGTALSAVALAGWVSWLSRSPSESEGGAVLFFAGTPLLAAACAGAVTLAAWAPLEMANRATPERVSFHLAP